MHKRQFGGSGRGGEHARVLGPLDCAIASKLAAQNTCLVDAATATPESDKQTRATRDKNGDSTFELNGELLHGGQGKNNELIIDNCEHIPVRDLERNQFTDDNLEGLNPPRLEETGEAIRGDDRKIMCKEIK